MSRKLTKSQIKKRMVWFEDWKDKLPRKLEKKISELPAGISKQMDFSIDSLPFFEEYLLSLDELREQYASMYSKNEEIIDFSCSYLGEVVRRKFPNVLNWVVGERGKRFEGEEYFTFFPALRTEIRPTGIDPYYDISSALGKRSGNTFMEAYNRTCRIIDDWKNQGQIIDQEKKTPGDGQYYHHYWLLVNDNFFDFSKLKETVKTHFKKRKQDCEVYYFNPSWLVVKLKNYNFHFNYDTSNDVQVEMKELAEDYTGRGNKTLISDSIARIEFWGDRDDNQDYMNEALFLLQNLNEQQGLHFYDFKSGHLWADKTMKST